MLHAAIPEDSSDRRGDCCTVMDGTWDLEIERCKNMTRKLYAVKYRSRVIYGK